MIYLGELLAYLDRGEADEVVMQSGQPPRIRVADEERKLGSDPLSRDAILAALHGAAVGAVVPNTDTAGEVQMVSIRGRDYLINIARFLDLLEVRIAALPLATKEASSRPATRREAPVVEGPAAEHPTRRDRAVGPLAAAALDHASRPSQDSGEAARAEHPTKRESFGVGPLAAAALEAAPSSEQATKREALAVGPLATAALEAQPTSEQRTRRETFGVGPLAAAALGIDDGERDEEREDERHDVSALTAALDLDPTDRHGRSPVGNAATIMGTPARARVPHPASATRPVGTPTQAPSRPAGVPGRAPARAPASSAPAAEPGPARSPAPVAERDAPRPISAAELGRARTQHVTSAPRAAESGQRELPDTVADILCVARGEGASDAHLSSEAPVRVRIAGRLEERGILVDHRLLASTVEKILAPSQAAQLASRGHVDLAFQDPAAGRLRINMCRQRGGLKLCARLLPASPPSREQLGLPPEMNRIDLLHQGLVVIAGPSGHGKTTTMAALVDALAASRPIHIITVEDPIEIVHPAKRALVTQREVGTHTKSFANALSAALREDPDVIAIGEMRDRETVAMALTAAETGHLVLATMNTPSGAKTIERLIELFPPEDQSQVRATLCGALKLVVSQRLLPRAEGRGLVAAYEVIAGGPPLWGLIRDRKLHQLPSLLQRGRAFGMRRLEESLRDLLVDGRISEETALRNAEDPRVITAGTSTGVESWNPRRLGGA